MIIVFFLYFNHNLYGNLTEKLQKFYPVDPLRLT